MSNIKNGLNEKQSFDSLFFWGVFPVTIALILSIFMLLFLRNLPQKLPLFYSLPWGDRQLIRSEQLFIIPALIIIVALGNLVICWQLHYHQTFFKKILIVSSLVTSGILTLTFIRIVSIFI